MLGTSRATRVLASLAISILLSLGTAPIRDHSGRAATHSKTLRETSSGVVAVTSLNQLPLHFEENRGHVDPRVRFHAQGLGYHLLLTTTEAIFVLGGSRLRREPRVSFLDARAERPAPQRRAVVRMRLEGAHRAPKVTGLEELPGKANYFLGNDPRRWRTMIPTYARVRYQEVYPGIDLVYYGTTRQVEYDFVVAPRADPGHISVAFEGVDRLEVDPRGDLIMDVAGERLRQRRPTVYQVRAGRRDEVSAAYVLRGGSRVGFWS